MNYKKRYFHEDFDIKDFSSFVLGADVGGTNTNICIAGIKKSKPIVLYSFHFDSKNLTSLDTAFNEILRFSKETYNIVVKTACIGAAGIVSPEEQVVELTNVHWNIDLNDLKNKTLLEHIYIINDFQAIGYGINLLDKENPDDLLIVRSGMIQGANATKVVIGAGTGLGKSILVYDESFDAYIPIPSEGGHTDFPFLDDQEMELVQFVKKFRKISHPLPYEELLSGRGIEGIYQFLRQRNDFQETMYTNEIDGSDEKAMLISKYKEIDETCKHTFLIFTKFYGRCAKNYVLDTLANGGLYIAGGIASKNKEIFSSEAFYNEFINGYRREEFLSKVPISIIINYDVSLYGACFAALYFLKKKDSV